jgi:hypothetical protein
MVAAPNGVVVRALPLTRQSIAIGCGRGESRDSSDAERAGCTYGDAGRGTSRAQKLSLTQRDSKDSRDWRIK